MLRVISGKARNLKLVTPAGMATRPTTDRIKETLFNMLQCDVPGSVFIDFYAGSGSIGIEALSRGAKHAYFIDNGKEAVKCIVENLNHTHLADDATVLSDDAVTSLYRIKESHADIIFMDPPYDQGFEKTLLSALRQMPYVDKDTIIIVESKIETDFSYVSDLGYEIEKEKKYKTNKHVYLFPV